MVSKRKTVAGGAAGGWQKAVIAWALAALKGAPGADKARAALDKAFAGSRLEPIAERFALSPLERHVVELLFAVERSAEARKAGHAAHGLTVESLRETLGDHEVDAALLPSRPLRAHALVDCSLATVLWSDEAVRLGPGLAHRLEGEAITVADLAPGLRLVRAGAEDAIASRYLALVERELAADAPDLVVLEGASWYEAVETGRALSRKQGRAVVVADAPALAPHAASRNLFSSLRRDLDLDGHALLVRGVGAAGDSFWALAAPLEGLSRRVAALPLEAPPPPPPEAKATVKDDGLDHIRRMAVRDAELALGIVRKDPPRPIPPPMARPQPPAPAPAAPPVKRQMPERIAEKLRARGIDPSTIDYQGPEESQQAPVVATRAAQPATPPPAVEVVPQPASALPLIDVPADAKPDQIAKLASTCPNPDQRVELIERLRGIKSPSVVAVLRQNAKSEHPAVRAAAESVMAQLFGANWNVTRPVPKPVQPPPSDDKDRGPPGGF